MRRLMDEDREEQEAQQRRARMAYSRVGLAMLVLAATAWGLQIGLQLLAQQFLPSLLKQEAFYWFLTTVPMYLVAMPLCARILRTLPDAPEPDLVELHPGQMVVLAAITLSLSILGGYMVTLVVALVEYATGQPVPDTTSTIDSLHLLPTFLVVCLIGPAMEEWLFRGVLVRKLRPYGDGLCVFASAFTFMLLHGNLYQTVNIFMVGALFAYVAVRTGTIWYSVILHMGLNLTATMISRAALAERVDLLSGLGLFVLVVLPIGLILTLVLLRADHRRPDALHLTGAGTFLGSPGMLAFSALSLCCLLFNVLPK